MSLILNSRPIVIIPELASKIGINEAVVIQQLHYWTKDTKTGLVIDGKRWVYNTYSEWQKQFPFMSKRTIQRAFLKLENLGLIDSTQARKSAGDRTKYYSVNAEKVAELEFEIAKEQCEEGEVVAPNWHYHNAKMALPSCQNGTLSTESTSESTTEKTPQPPSTSKMSCPCPVDEILSLWKKVLPEKRQPVPSILKQGQTGRLLQDRWQQCMKIDHSTENRKLYHDTESGLEFWEALFNMIRQSEFLMSPQSKWFTFGWMVKKSNFEKLLSGDYQ